jgi:endonuclease YncB( thermonuclease family)
MKFTESLACYEQQVCRNSAQRLNRYRWVGTLQIALVLWLLHATNLHAGTLTGRVVYVADGDSVIVKDAAGIRHRIRLSGIDAPELKQRFGGRAKQNLYRLLFNNTVSVEYDKRDEHGRLVGKVMVASPDACPDASNTCPKTLDAGMAQLTVGLAWWYRYYAAEQTEQDQHRYEFAEYEARARKAGLWGDAAPVPPWDWRRSNR